MNYSTYLIKTLWRPLVRALTVLLLLPAAFAADFGVAQWGNDLEQVKALETRINLTPFGETNYLIYQVSLPNIQQTRIIYQFTNGTLTAGQFTFAMSNPRDVQGYVQQYGEIKKMISGQYGAPNTDEVLHRDANMPPLVAENYANELASDRLILKSTWRSPTAQIKHQLAWYKNRPHHQLVYLPMNLQTTDAPLPAAF